MTTEDQAFPQHSTILAPGLTKRELFAAMAMQAHIASATAIGIEASKAGNDESRLLEFEVVAANACKQSDALIAELAKERP